MKFDINDSRLTAYALGELNEAESRLVEELMRENSRAKAFVEEIKATALTLENEFKAETLPQLDAKQVKTIEKRFPQSFFPRLTWKWALSLAPVALVTLLAINLRINDVWQPREDQVSTPVVNGPQTSPSFAEETYFQDAQTDSVETEFNIAATEPQPSATEPQPSATEQKSEFVPPPPMKQAAIQEYEALYNSAGSSLSESIEQSDTQASAPKAKLALQGSSILETKVRNYPASMDYSGLSLSRNELHKDKDLAFNTEQYSHFKENIFLKVVDQPLSTFSIDVDTASYSNIRRFLSQGTLPPKDAVRIEEMINHFSYDYKEPSDGKPFSVNLEMAAAPWDGSRQLVRIGLKGQAIHPKERPATNLVFLLDVSGSMDEPNKLPLLKQSMKLLVKQLGASDRVAIVVYAGNSGVVLAPTPGNKHAEIMEAFDKLHAGGGTNGGEGIEAAYKLAAENFIKGGVNRVILATDGDFNVGVSSEGELIRLIQEKAKSGVFLSVLGFGMGNLKDSTMVKLANKGNGQYAYIDTLSEAKKVLVEEIGGTLVTIAKDVKIQVEFNPKHIASYRLIGYEKRALQNEDFNNDIVDAGEIGAGHTVTAFYEVIPVGKDDGKAKVDPLKYQNKPTLATNAGSEALTVKLRYKKPDEETSQLLEVPMSYKPQAFTNASSDFQFASAVASFGMLLRNSEHKARTNYKAVADLAEKMVHRNGRPDPYRKEFVELVRKAHKLTPAK